MNTLGLIDKNPAENNQIHTESYYEEVASEEEIYLEEREERARTVLISESSFQSGLTRDNGSPGVNSSLPVINTPPREESGGATELDDATQELVTGDSDDPPLSDEAVEEMLRKTQND